MSRFVVAAMVGMSLVSPCAVGQTTGQAKDSVVYRLSPASRFDVTTGKAGLFGFAGHAHLIRARRFSGRVVYYRDAPLLSRVEIHVETAALEVLTPPDSEEIRKVTAAMQADVLHVTQYPEVVFESRALAAVPGGFRIVSRLSIAGRTRDVPVEVLVEVGRDTLRANATFAVNQTDFGIKPYRGGPAGTVRVADRVTFAIAAVAVREAPQ